MKFLASFHHPIFCPFGLFQLFPDRLINEQNLERKYRLPDLEYQVQQKQRLPYYIKETIIKQTKQEISSLIAPKINFRRFFFFICYFKIWLFSKAERTR